jgi:hypothetical protein
MSEERPDDQEIRRMLVQLHDRLETARTLDEDERAMMRHLMADIQDMLRQPGKEETPRIQPSRSFLNRLQESIDILEVNHPTLTVMIEKLLDTLNLVGI